ncbi:uncharacterized protein LOC125898016 [Scomber scombrus]|uniref:Uncharacterized protein LOC125898016 n=1 Tax=Scomber scombrus TaxID=13677 RepID=A0AAV1Q6M3_SCOSC
MSCLPPSSAVIYRVTVSNFAGTLSMSASTLSETVDRPSLSPKISHFKKFLLLLLKYFNEEEEQMFYKVDQTTLPSEVDCAGLPSTPCIVVCGNSTLAAENFMLSVDQTIVNGHIRIFSDALLLMFGSYYCMNISYPAAQASTLEFLQRCLFKINTDKGSKVERNATKKQLAVSPKGLTLITKIADYEWRE